MRLTKLARSLLARRLTGSIILLLTGVLFVQFTHVTSKREERVWADKVNLALRLTAHRLLRSAGDSTSRIQPVQQVDPHVFRLRFDRAFNYDQLPQLLKASLMRHQVTGAYDVAVLDCQKSELQLGYRSNDLLGNEPVPCGGRAMNAGCYVLQLTFDAAKPVSQPGMGGWLLAAGGLLTGLLVVFWPRPSAPTEPTKPTEDTSNRLHIGNTVFDVSQQIVTAGGHQHSLTYREAKLLRLFVEHANQVLERDAILKAVWEDEGVTVGRSVDVFVSRLRKLLQHDPALRIAAVHGVGYRLEVKTNDES